MAIPVDMDVVHVQDSMQTGELEYAACKHASWKLAPHMRDIPHWAAWR